MSFCLYLLCGPDKGHAINGKTWCNCQHRFCFRSLSTICRLSLYCVQRCFLSLLFAFYFLSYLIQLVFLNCLWLDVLMNDHNCKDDFKFMYLYFQVVLLCLLDHFHHTNTRGFGSMYFVLR